MCAFGVFIFKYCLYNYFGCICGCLWCGFHLLIICNLFDMFYYVDIIEMFVVHMVDKINVIVSLVWSVAWNIEVVVQTLPKEKGINLSLLFGVFS